MCTKFVIALFKIKLKMLIIQWNIMDPLKIRTWETFVVY